jgi:hypothetical protein
MLSGYSGAIAFGLKIQACTASLNFETFFSISSAEDESTTSQPVSKRQRAEAGAACDETPAREVRQTSRRP